MDEQNNISKKSIFKRWWFWVIIIILLLLIAAIYIIRPFEPVPEQKDIAIPAFSDPKCTRVFSPQFNAAPYYQGSLFDTHLHLPPTFEHKESGQRFAVLGTDLSLNDLVCELEKEKVVGTLSFYFPNFWQKMSGKMSQSQFDQWTINEASKIKKGTPPWMHILFTAAVLSPEETDSIYNSSGNIFDGFGELVYFFPAAPRMFSKVDDETSLGIEKIANDNKLIVMVHPGYSQKNNLENALKRNPNATFVLHGWEHDDYVTALMDKYPNLYFTIDAATLYPIYGKIDGSGEKFLPALKKDFNSILDNDVKKWKVQIERYPTRFMWGTDRYYDWHYSNEANLLFEEFARAFIGRLDSSVQERFAYKNAQCLFTKDVSCTVETKKSQNKSSLGELPEATRLCAIDKIGNDNWEKLAAGSRPATIEEQQIIDQCSRQ